MNARNLLFAAGTLACLASGVAFYNAPAKAEEPLLVLAQNEEDSGFWGRVFNRSDKSTAAKPLFLDRANPSPSGRGAPYDYGSRTSGNSREKPFTDQEGVKIMLARDAIVQKRTDEILRLAALENEKRSAALEKSILETNARAAQGTAPEEGKGAPGKTKMVYDPQKTKTQKAGAAPYTARSGSSQDPEENQSSVPTGRLYNAR